MDCLSVRLHFNYTDGRYLAAHEILQRYCDVSKFPKSKKILATPSRLGVARPCLRAVLGSKFAHLNITIADVSFFKNEWVVQEIQKQGWICVDWSIPTLLFITYLMYGMREQPYITYMMYRKRAARIFDPRRQPEKSQKSCKRNTANVLNGCDIGAILMVYLGRYQDLRDEWKNRQPTGEKEDIIDDIVFEIELIKQIEINIDYILLLVKKFHDSHCSDKEVLVTIQKAIDASPELRSKKALIETFIAGINDVSDVMIEWRTFVAEEKERQLATIIEEEKLKPEETRQFIESAFRDGMVKTTGTDIDKLMPPISRFGGGNRAEKKKTVIEKLLGFFERFFGI